MKSRRSPGEVLAILFLLTLMAVVVVFPALSSGCDAGEICINGTGENQQGFQPFRNLLVSASDCPTSFEQMVILLINVERANRGYAPLTLDIRLQAAARWMSDDMADRDDVSTHVGSDDSTPRDRMLREGYNLSIPGGPENIAGGFPSPESLVTAWMGSPDSQEYINILNPIYEHLGVGYTFQDMPFFDHYWTVDFGATDDPRQPPLPSCDPGFHRMYFPIIFK